MRVEVDTLRIPYTKAHISYPVQGGTRLLLQFAHVDVWSFSFFVQSYFPTSFLLLNCSFCKALALSLTLEVCRNCLINFQFFIASSHSFCHANQLKTRPFSSGLQCTVYVVCMLPSQQLVNTPRRSAWLHVFKKLLLTLSAFTIGLITATDTVVVSIKDRNFHLFFPYYVFPNKFCQDREVSLSQLFPTQPRQCVISWMLIHK